VNEEHSSEDLRRLESAAPLPRRKFPWAIIVVVALFVIIPFLAWYGTWFGRPLSDNQIDQYLNDQEKPRHIQQAIEQIAGRIDRHDSSAEKWYPALAELAHHAVPQVRTAAAWAMQSDTTYEGFHTALLSLLQDEDPTARHQAALSLVRFQDASGRPELVSMLKGSTLRASAAGTVSTLLKEGSAFRADTPIIRIKTNDGQASEVRSVESGRLDRLLVTSGATVRSGEEVAAIAPGSEQVWEALWALYVVGIPEDLSYIQRYTRDDTGVSDRIRKQAVMTVEAIRSRSRQTGQASD
jgi:HEAT repeat protein